MYIVSNVHEDDKFDFIELLGESKIEIEKIDTSDNVGFNTYKITYDISDLNGIFNLLYLY